MIPFFVVDRKSQIQFFINNYEYLLLIGKIGLMSHANNSIPTLKTLKSALVRYKFCDSGAFIKGATKKSDSQLLDTYHRYGITDGIMMDEMKNKSRTLEQASSIYNLYTQYPYKFNLWGVAQGVTTDDYMECYRELKEIGFTHIAIGGMIIINKKSPFPKVDEGLLYSVLKELRRLYPQDISFALGTLSHSRYYSLSAFNILGADSGQWRFKYNSHNQMGSFSERRIRKFKERKEWIDTKMIPKLKRKQMSADEFF